MLLLWMPTHTQKSTNSSIPSWNIGDPILGITFGTPKCALPHPYKWTELNRCIYKWPTKYKKSTSYLSWVLKLSWLTILHYFRHAVACLTTPTWNDWVYLLLLLMLDHIQKFKFISHLICEIWQFKESCFLIGLEVFGP